MKILREIGKAAILFVVGGLIYMLIEVLFRGYTHWTMGIVGGLCFVIIGGINNWLPWELPIWVQGLIGMAVVTVIEFISGLILNVWLKMDIWDYSDMPLNLLGQICVPFMAAWFFVSLAAIVLDDYLRYWLFKEEKPHYVWWFKGE